MHLTRERFFEILDAPRPFSEARLHDLRQDRRVPVDLTAEIVPLEYGLPGTPTHVQITELSAGGISLVSPVPRPLGGRFALKLPSNSGPQLVVVCEIRHCRLAGRGSFHVGAVFLRSAEGEFDEVLPAFASLA
ncbi:MAG: PilZ domain-containing protein [Phycisphaerae bacterium]|nr:PilZ domain-containing protein [Phycisphaerae bacterium]MDW8262085.1 PilZ domain-containing protein [Phycisphaerales bacterium]